MVPGTRLNEGLCKRWLGGQVTHPKFQSYVKANPDLEEQALNLLLFTWGQGDHSSVTVPEVGGGTPTLGRGYPGQDSL